METSSIFPVPFMFSVYFLVEQFLQWYLEFWNRLLGPFQFVMTKQQNFVKIWCHRTCALINLLPISFLWMPASIFFLLRCFLLKFKNPITLSYCDIPLKKHNKKHSCTCKEALEGETVTVSIATSNVCLLPEYLSRFNLLPNTEERAVKIGERILFDQLDSWYIKKNSIEYFDKNNMEEDGFVHNVVKHFPHLDFICFQECWNRAYSQKLMSSLHSEFPWILYDIGNYSFTTNYFLFNSGLMFASRYEIIDTDFKHFPHSYSQCIFNSKGLLMTKVLLASHKGKDFVGYVFNTHLQAYPGGTGVTAKQLDKVLAWTEQFVKESRRHSDVIMFDMLCGDFNIDNMSPGDEACWRHPLFQVYEDVCRQRAGVDKSWTAGTEMRQKYMEESNVRSPSGLRNVLLDPELRHRYIIDGNIKCPTLSAIVNAEPSLNLDKKQVSSAPWAGKRRIDYILYRKSIPHNARRFHYVSSLASLTDHIPISMTFTLTSSTKKKS